MQTIRLEGSQWTFDNTDRLGPAGGFGEVFRGTGQGQEVAIKRLKLSAGAASHREMKIGAALAERSHDHIVPILDFGQDADSDRYFLVMPVCDHSLQDVLSKTGPLAIADAKAAALDIVAGLREVEDIVHRDLKPGNVLWHEGRWKIADFGIAKFVEDATSLQSLRTSLTPAYAAPEQWKGERPTTATDVYALGCILYAMLTGAPPFLGSADDIREAHLHAAPSPLTGFESRLAGLVATMLRKTPASRPSIARCTTVLTELQTPIVSSGREALAAAGLKVSEEEAAAEAVRTAREAAERERADLAKEAIQEILGMVARLFDVIEADTHTARRERRAISLGPAHLVFDQPQALGTWPPGGQGDPFQTHWDVVAYACLKLRCDRGRATQFDPGYYVFEASLVFSKSGDGTEYRWREISFHEVFTQRSFYDQPFGLNPMGRDFQVAISRTMGKHQIAHGPLAIDGEDENSFQERWLKLFAKAAARQLGPPSGLPLHSSFFS